MDFKKEIIGKIPIDLALYYAVSFSILVICSKYFKSGPCTPNFDVLAFLIFNVISLVSILVCLILIVLRKKENIPRLILHIIALLILYTAMYL
jgi:hypothetical protein